MNNYYEILELSPSANQNEIRKAYYRLAKKWHPDKNPNSDTRTKFEEIHYAYEQLSGENHFQHKNNSFGEVQGNGIRRFNESTEKPFEMNESARGFFERNPDTKSFFDKFSEEGKRDFCERLEKNGSDAKPREDEWQKFNEFYSDFNNWQENSEYKEDKPWNSISDEEKIEILKIRIARLKSNLSEPGYLNEKQKQENLEQIDEFEEEIRLLKEQIIIRLKFEIQQLRKEKESLQDPSKISQIEEEIARKEKKIKELKDSLESYYKSLDSGQLDDEIKRTKSELEKAKDDKSASGSERKKELEEKLEKLEEREKNNDELRNNKIPVKIIIGGGVIFVVAIISLLAFKKFKKIKKIFKSYEMTIKNIKH